jgi:hypothetical protein
MLMLYQLLEQLLGPVILTAGDVTNPSGDQIIGFREP